MGFFKRAKDMPADMVDLTKKARVSLEKHGIADLKAAVYLVLDHSGSMHSHYRNGDVQKLAERALGLSANLDDDGTVPVVLFGSRVESVTEVGVNSYQGIASTLSSRANWGSTNYVAAIDAVLAHYEKSGASDPALVIFQTDGNPDDVRATTAKIRSTAKKNIFWAFVSFGSYADYLDTLDKPQDPADDNVSHFRAPKPSQVSDEELYDGITSEFSAWIKR